MDRNKDRKDDFSFFSFSTLLLNLPNSLKALALVGSTFARPSASVNIFTLSHVKNMRGNGDEKSI